MESYNFYELTHPSYTFETTTIVNDKTEDIARKGECRSYERKIRIPQIQRDYAEGRQNDETIRKITRFTKNLLDVLYDETKSTSLDFIYGYVLSNDGGSVTSNMLWNDLQSTEIAFEPLDGQQRLTTLFLLYWLFGREKDLQDTRDGLSLFVYATRESSTEFCNELIKHHASGLKGLISEWQQQCTNINAKNEDMKARRKECKDKYAAQLKFPYLIVPKLFDFIQTQEWFKWSWRTDPTIISMLHVLDCIYEQLDLFGRKYEDGVKYNRNLDNIRFSLLDNLDCNGNKLFVKMNARGKKLSVFDLAKSSLEEELEEQQNSYKSQWAQKMDGDWQEYCWRIVTSSWKENNDNDWTYQNVSKVEEFQLCLIKRWIGRSFWKKRENMHSHTNPNIRSVDMGELLANSAYGKCDDIITIYEDYIDNERKQTFIQKSSYEKIDFETIGKEIDSLLYKDNDVWYDITEDLQKDGFSFEDSSLLKYYITKNIEYIHRVLLHALLTYTAWHSAKEIKQDNELKNEFVSWMRFIWHIARPENRTQRIDSPDEFDVFLRNIDSFVENWKTSKKTFQDFMMSKESDVFTKEKDRYAEEKEKANLCKNYQNWEEYLNKIEDSPFLLGQYCSPLKWSRKPDGSYDLEIFKGYVTALRSVFDEPSNIDYKFTLSMLGKEDYLFNVGATFASLRNCNPLSRDYSWKRVLRDVNAPINDTLREWIDSWLDSKKELNDYVDYTITDAKNRIKSDDWRYYLLQLDVDNIKKVLTEHVFPVSDSRNIRLQDGHPYFVHAQTSRGDRQYDIVIAYLAYVKFANSPKWNIVTPTTWVRSDLTELILESANTKVQIVNKHDNKYYVTINGALQKEFNDIEQMILTLDLLP